MNPIAEACRYMPSREYRFVILVVALLVAGLISCAGDETVPLPVGDHTFHVEIADTPESRRQGLMFRDELGPDEGMLFVFPNSRIRSFWMTDS